jgi:hypothetical protein
MLHSITIFVPEDCFLLLRVQKEGAIIQSYKLKRSSFYDFAPKKQMKMQELDFFALFGILISLLCSSAFERQFL